MSRLTTPEGLAAGSPFSNWQARLGPPITILHDVHPTVRQNAHIFREGLWAVESVAGVSAPPFMVGVYDTGICNGAGFGFPYIAHLGHPDVRVILSRTGGFGPERIGEPIPGNAVKAQDRIFIGVELTFQPRPTSGSLTMTCKVISPTAEVEIRDPVRHHPLTAGQTTHLSVFVLNPGPPRAAYGEWRIEITINGTLLKQVSFTNQS